MLQDDNSSESKTGATAAQSMARNLSDQRTVLFDDPKDDAEVGLTASPNNRAGRQKAKRQVVMRSTTTAVDDPFASATTLGDAKDTA